VDDRDPRLTHSHEASPRRRWLRVALAASLLLVAVGVALLPFVVRSMIEELFSTGAGTLYDIMTGEAVTVGKDVDPDAAEYLNIAPLDIDEATGALTLAVSGNRTCTGACPSVRLTFLSLDNDASRRRGIAPFATVRLGPEDVIYSDTITLPMLGTPACYPFDTYELWLGLAQPPDGTERDAPPPRPADSPFIATFQNQVPQLVMEPPLLINAAGVRTSGSLALQTVLALSFSRPAYLSVLSVVLVLLVAASGALALLTQTIDNLVLGIGGLILGIWGVRSVLVPQPVAVVTAVDLALSGVILFLLLALAARATLYLHRQSGLKLPLPRPRRRG